MNGSAFTPNLKSVPKETENHHVPDTVGGVLLKVAQYAVLVLMGGVTLFFTPGVWASLGFDKTVFTIALAGIALMAVSLVALRMRHAHTVLPLSLGLFWAVVGVAVLSALLSGDIQDSLVGSALGPQTAGFLFVMALVMSVTLVLQGSKLMTIKALALFGCVSCLLLAYNIARILFGGEFLSFGSFGSVTSSPIGSFNDLGLFAGLVVLLGLITLLQLPLRGLTQAVVALLIYMGLFVLAVVNFFNIWLIIGFFGLLLFVYLISRDTLFSDPESEEKKQPISKVLLLTTAIVCITSAVFVVGGDYAGNKINSLTNIDYIEVRPSVESTLDITKAVYSENVLFGIGPNRFADAWRLHKNIGINETIFWDTDFTAGIGYIPTLFVTLGALGAVLLLVFHAYFLLLGYRMFLKNSIQDSYWYYFGILSFSGAVFLWGMSYIYVPGASILLLTAVFTGCTFVAYRASTAPVVFTIPLARNRQRGFVLMATTIVVITMTIGAFFTIGEQYTAQARFAQAQVNATSVEDFEQVAGASYALFPDDRFVSARAQIHLATLNAILNIQEPAEENQQQFITAAEQAGALARQAVSDDPTNPDNHAILAGLYNTLAIAGFEGAQERARESLSTAERLDPLNPAYKLLAAQIAIRADNTDLARAEINAALGLKRNYTQALYLSAQLDIAQSNVESALSTTQAIIALEPNNPTRYFQLGVLLLANEDTTQAIEAFKAAIARDAEYANARYFLALAHVNNNQPNLALEQLEIVQRTNADNQELAALIAQITNGELDIAPNTEVNAPVNDSTVAPGPNTTVPAGESIDTDLVTPVNTVPATDTPNDDSATSDAEEE